MNEDAAAARHTFGADAISQRSRGGRGDPRMRRALYAKLADPKTTALDALLAGGFEFPNLGKAGMTDRVLMDSENVSLEQRKNQLNRRVRKEKRKMLDASQQSKRQTEDEHAIIDAKRQKIDSHFSKLEDSTAFDALLAGGSEFPNLGEAKMTNHTFEFHMQTNLGKARMTNHTLMRREIIPIAEPTNSYLSSRVEQQKRTMLDVSQHPNRQPVDTHAMNEAKNQKIDFNQPNNTEDKNDGKICPSMGFGDPGSALTLASIYPQHLSQSINPTTSCTSLDQATLHAPLLHSCNALSSISGATPSTSYTCSAQVADAVSSLPSPEKANTTTATQHINTTAPTDNGDYLDFDVERLAAVLGIDWES